MRQLLFLSSLCALLTGCPDPVAPTGNGGTENGGDGGAGTITGGDGGGGSSIPTTSCFADGECEASQYCAIPNGSFEGLCVEGCRDSADSCGSGEVCDPETRTCTLPPCEDDSACPEGTYCNDASVCEQGCRLEDACPGETDADGRLLLCDPETRTCVPHSPCCVPGDGEEQCVSASSAAQCEAQGGQLLLNALLCDDSPCTDRCELDVDCEGLDVPGVTHYCDETDGRCREGCRVGDCEGDLVCDPVQRVCVNQACVGSDDCGEGQYCDPIDLVCVTGCGADADCPSGLGCVSNVCVERCDPANDSCGEGRYCDEQSLVCREACLTHDDCAESEACDPLSGQCKLGECRDDEPLGDLAGEPNSTFETASQITLIPIPTEPTRAVGRAEGRVICGADLDYYRVGLAQGERMRLTMSHEVSSDLRVRLFSETNLMTPLWSSVAGENPDLFEYPPEGEVEDAQGYLIEVSGALDAADRVGYDLTIQTAPFNNACFSDPREGGEGDDDYAHATELVANGTTRYDDGSVCVGDEDWFSLPLTVNDGLQVTVSTPIEANAIALKLYPRARFGGITGDPAPSYEVSLEQSVEDVEAGLRLYTLSVARDSAGFEIDGDWLIAVTPAELNGYASYQIEVTHEAAGGVCVNEAREPNNSVSDADDLEADFGFLLDNSDLLAQGRDNRLDSGVICAGDVDYYCLNLAEGDLLSAWAVSDTVIGQLEVRLVDSEGGAVGVSGLHTVRGVDPQPATLVGAPAGRYCVVVDGRGNAQGPYELTVRREVLMGGACSQDESAMPNNNNTAARATPLPDVSGGLGTRFEQRNGLMCDVGADPADWYSFSVAQERSRVCVMLEGFNSDLADLDVELFGPANLTTTACTNDSQCVAEGSVACIDGHCQIDAARSVFSFDFELASQPRVAVSAGEHHLRVARGAAGAVSPYDLSVTVTPGRAACQDDWQELGDRNDLGGFNAIGAPTRATQLGSGAVGLCDTWLCNSPEGPEIDWYEVTVPAGEDRTVIINFESESDGPLDLYFWGETATSMQNDQLYMVSTTNTNYQCLNLRGGQLENLIELGVDVSGGVSGAFINDGDQRIDYSLRVVPVDLDVQPDGACALFGAGAVSTCEPGEALVTPDGALASTCWPEAELP